MIIINKANLECHGQLNAHAKDEMEQRQQYNRIQNAFMRSETGDALIANRNGIFDRDFWLEIDRAANETFNDTRGREIYDDLQSLVTVLPLGKTVKAYTNTGDIAKDVRITMDGQAPFTFDQTGYGGDADPIPMFNAGYGINYRHMLGLQTDSIPLMVDSQRAKLEVFNATTSNYLLNGSEYISEAGFKGQGLKNHRNTGKIDLGTSGANINLTTATADEVVSFFTVYMRGVLDVNNIPMIDVLWVSKEVMANLAKPFSAAAGFKEGTVLENVMRLAPFIGAIKTAYSTDLVGVENAGAGIINGLDGNEILGYVKSKSFIEIPTGQAVSIVPLPRLMPRSNFNNDISSAFGVQVKKNRGNFGVFYGSALT